MPVLGRNVNPSCRALAEMDRVGRGQVVVHPLANDVAIRSQGRDVKQGQAGLAVERLAHDLGDHEPLRSAALVDHFELDQVAAGNGSGRLGVAQAGPAYLVPLALHQRARAPRPRRAAWRAAVRRREVRSGVPGWLSPHRRRRRRLRRRRRPRRRGPHSHRRLPRRRPHSRRCAVRRRLHSPLDGRATAAASPRALASRRHGARGAAHAPGKFQVNPR